MADKILTSGVKRPRYWLYFLGISVLICLAGCQTTDEISTATGISNVAATYANTAEPDVLEEEAETSFGLTADEIETLDSLRMLDDYPLYTMRFTTGTSIPVAQISTQQNNVPAEVSSLAQAPAWACSLFAAFGDSDGTLFGRNFDWRYSPALLLFTDPVDGYASVSMVDIEYIGFGEDLSGIVDMLPLDQRRALLDAPSIPFDGMNERGVVVGMAAVPTGDMQPDPSKETIGSLGVIREILDHAGDTNEAVEIMRAYNIDMGDGPPLHYLIADTSGKGALVEFFQGEMRVIPNQSSWLQATNFLRSAHEDQTEGVCQRFDRLSQQLEETGGITSMGEAMELLRSVSQANTQWSIVYGMNDGQITVTMGREYDVSHEFELEMKRDQ